MNDIEIDPQLQAVMRRLAEIGLPPLEKSTPAERRATVMVMREFQGLEPSVAGSWDVSIPARGHEIPARVYVPEGDRPIGAIAFFHGGGWISGTRDSYDFPCRLLARTTGCALVSVEYRLAPENPFPAPFEAAVTATAWVAEHASEWKAAPGKLVVAGDSSGGNLAAAAALHARDRGEPAIAYQVLIYPVLQKNFETPSYTRYAEGPMLTRAGMQTCWGHYVGTEEQSENAYAAPLRAKDLRGLAPVCLVSSEHDPLLSEAQLYAERLREAGVPVDFVFNRGLTHSVIHMAGAVDAARRMFDEIGGAVRKALAEPAARET